MSESERLEKIKASKVKYNNSEKGKATKANYYNSDR
jgi:hypothetical protein